MYLLLLSLILSVVTDQIVEFDFQLTNFLLYTALFL